MKIKLKLKSRSKRHRIKSKKIETKKEIYFGDIIETTGRTLQF